MEGNLLVPPDRGTIIGRAVWKSRYVVIGPVTAPKDASQQNLSLAQVLTSSRIKDVSGRGSKPQHLLSSDTIYLSVYKTKEELELVQQHSISSIKECQVQHIAHRKQGHVLPTLCVQVSPDPVTDKLRKRRSSRTAGLTTTKDSGPTTLWFRSTEDSSYTLADWARCIQTLIQPGILDGQPMSPISPTSPTFINPFAPSVSQGPTEHASSANGKEKKRTKVRPKTFASTRDPAVAYSSESPSLRSRKSDLSSRASLNPVSVGYAQQHYTLVHPSELPSPAPTVGEYNNEIFIEGWTSAQGRSSTLSSPVRGRASISSSQCPAPPSLDSSSPPAPRETILDRAFQLRCIPGSDRELPGEEKLSSLARFEALMREAEDRQRTLHKDIRTTQEPMRSTWEEDDESEDGSDVGEHFDDEEDSDGFEHDVDQDSIGPSASKALQFIADRHNTNHGRPPWPLSARATVHYSSSGGFDSGPSILRPHTAHSRLRTTQRTTSQPQLPPPSAEIINQAALNRVPDENRRSHEKRHSTSEVKHLSFNDFTQRLSSSSSLLLVQTNTSADSRRGSGDLDQAQQATPRANLSPRGPNMSPSERDERCRWRGSIGVFGANEGGFL
ncbi:hypothetical protein F5X96DRAFT_689852 [Biscogniauxia mediterranea]|nr:hypothetical protein F5X96DRAFT_689852 [Biscogniauxia mediterranea]